MKRRTFSNIVLLVVAAGLGIFIVTRPDQEERLVLEPLSHENPRSVSHIRLELAAGSPIELRRVDGAWLLVEPVRIAANDFRIDGLLRVLNAPVHARIDTDTRELNPLRTGAATGAGVVRRQESAVLATPTPFTDGAIYSSMAKLHWWTTISSLT